MPISDESPGFPVGAAPLRGFGDLGRRFGAPGPAEIQVESLSPRLAFRSFGLAVVVEDAQPDRLVPLGDVRSREMRLVSRREVMDEVISASYLRLWRGL